MPPPASRPRVETSVRLAPRKPQRQARPTNPDWLAHVRDILLDHLHDPHAFYGDLSAACIARKHRWYARDRPEHSLEQRMAFRAVTADARLQLPREHFDAWVHCAALVLSAARSCVLH